MQIESSILFALTHKEKSSAHLTFFIELIFDIRDCSKFYSKTFSVDAKAGYCIIHNEASVIPLTMCVLRVMVNLNLKLLSAR